MKLKDLIKGIFGTNDIRVIMFDEDNETDSGNHEIYKGMALDIPKKILEEGVLNEKDFLVNDEDDGVMKIFINQNQELKYWFKHKDDKEKPKKLGEAMGAKIEVLEESPHDQELARIAQEEENWRKQYEGLELRSILDQIVTQLKLQNKMYFYKNFKVVSWSEEKEWDDLVNEFEKEVNK